MSQTLDQSSYFQKKFSKLNYQEKVVKDVEFEECQFDECNFLKASFENCNFINCIFKNSDLSLIKLINSSFDEIKFEDCKLIGVDWTKIKQKILPTIIQFDSCKIDLSSFFGLKLENFTLTNSSAKEVDFREATLLEANFNNTDLEETLFHQTNLRKTNFIGASHYQINFNNNKIEKATFSIPEVLNLLKPLKIKIKQVLKKSI